MSDNSNTIIVHFFAMFREIVGIDSQQIQVNDNLTADELFMQLASQYGFPEKSASLRVAINESFADWNTELKKGDTVAFIPAVNGG